MFHKIKFDLSFKSLYAQLILFSVLLYTPLVFFAFINEVLRISIFTIISFSLLTSIFFYKFNYSYFHITVFCFFLLLIYLSSSLYINTSPEAVRTAVGYFLILFFSFLFFYTITRNQRFKEIFLNKYIFFFQIVCVAVIINFILNLFSTSINVLTPFFPNYFQYSYNASPFGLSISKYILGVNISRNFFFFIEPVYTAPFFLMNIFVIGLKLSNKSKSFIALNFLAGLLTFSFLFFAGLIVLYLIRKWPKLFLIALIISLLVIMKISLNEDNSFIASTSTTDRLVRIQVATDILTNFSLIQLVSGNGYIFTQELEKGISAGLFSSFIEGGLIGLIVPLVLGIIYCKKNYTLIAILVISLLTIEPYKMPLFWVALILSGALGRIDLQNES